MDGSHHSSPTASDGPLLPLHHNTKRPLSRDSADFSPSSPPPNQPSHRVTLSVDAHQESDIADSAAHGDEKQLIMSAARQDAGNVKTASVEEEVQAINWIVPVENEAPTEKRRTVAERLESTLEVAKAEQFKYAERAKYAGMAINACMFAQITANALITGLSAAATGNRKAQIGVSALGALGTIISAFLVRVRGTREPERSATHAQNLEKYVRELEAFILDEGFSRDSKWDKKVHHFRSEFDRLQTAAHQSENGQSGTNASNTS